MKFGPDVLVEIVAIVQEGLLKGTDISDDLRKIEVDLLGPAHDLLTLSRSYVESTPRGTRSN